MRRLSFLAGPLAWLDWLPILGGDRRRALDRIADTGVVTFVPTERGHAESAGVEAGEDR